jgi:molybdopterin biosynthesis enzyme MoaB
MKPARRVQRAERVFFDSCILRELSDITPEASEAVCSKMMSGFGIDARCLPEICAHCDFFRQTAGIRGMNLIVNLLASLQRSTTA